MSELKEDEWEVEKILDVKKQNNQLKYLVKWKDFGFEYNIWKSEENLMNI
jgi:hypothetical protein